MTRADKSYSENIRLMLSGNQYALVDISDFPQFTYELFSPGYLATKNMLTGKAKGRGTTWFFAHNDKEYVMRTYLRGGLIAKFLSDQFFHLSYHRSRSWQEFKLLQQLQEWELPAPRPVVAMVKRSGLIYRSFLITERIPNAKDLFQRLCEGHVDAEVWRRIGRVIAKFHAHHVHHHDLNIRNIMLDDQDRPWLIDFDKCELRQPGRWIQENLDRLNRSYVKEFNRHSLKNCRLSDFRFLLEGYNN